MNYLYQKKLEEIGCFDVVVAGGGPAGIGAAITAARAGAKTLLLEKTGTLGGVSANSLLSLWLGSRKNGKFVNEGLFPEFIQRMHELTPITSPYETYGVEGLSLNKEEFIFSTEDSPLIFDRMACKAGVTTLFFSQVIDVIRSGNRLEALCIAGKSGLRLVRGRFFIDCTGDADLVAYAGFETRREPELAPMSLLWLVENVDSKQLSQYLAQGGDKRFRTLIAEQRKLGNWPWLDAILGFFPLPEPGVYLVNPGLSQVNLDGCRDEDLTRCMIQGREMAQHILKQIMHPFVPGFEQARIRRIAPFPGVRETRKIVAHYRLTEKDVCSGKKFEDTAARSNYVLDLGRLHRSKDGFLEIFQPGHSIPPIPVPVSIPTACMLPKEAENLIAAGRCVDADGQALGPIRVMAPCMAMGERAGTLATENLA